MSHAEYTFPFNTCETVSSWVIAQPVSFAVNSVTCLLLCMIAARTRKLAPATAIAAYALFEGFHSYSHARHIAGHVQLNIVHCIGYLMSISALFAISTSVHRRRVDSTATPWRLAVVASAVLVDLAATLTIHNTLVMVATGLGVLATVFVGYYDNLSRASQKLLIGRIYVHSTRTAHQGHVGYKKNFRKKSSCSYTFFKKIAALYVAIFRRV